MEFENQLRMLNYASAELDAQVGMAYPSPQIVPRPRPVIIGGTKVNNISVTNSVIGTINTGSIETIDQTITVLRDTDQSEVAEAIKELSDAVLSSADLSVNQRNEVVDILSVLAQEAALPKERRRGVVAQTLIEKAIRVCGTATDIAKVCEHWWPVIIGVFLQASS